MPKHRATRSKVATRRRSPLPKYKLKGAFFVDSLENPFESTASRRLKSQACGESTKNHPVGRSQVSCAKEDPDHIISGPPKNDDTSTQILSWGSLGFPRPIGKIIIFYSLTAIFRPGCPHAASRID